MHLHPEVPAATVQVAECRAPVIVLGHRHRLVDNQRRAAMRGQQVSAQLALEFGEDLTTLGFVRLVQVPHHDVGLFTIVKVEGLGLGEHADRHA